MGPDENKMLVHRFWNELIATGKVDLADELLAPDFVNLLAEGVGTSAPPTANEPTDGEGGDVARLKAAIADYLAQVKDARFEVLALAAEGDAVFARFHIVATRSDGTTTTSRALGYYRIVGGKIAMCDVMSVPA